ALPLVAFLHFLKRFDPAEDQLTCRKCRCLAGLCLVENHSVDELAAIGHGDKVVLCGSLAVSRPDGAILQTVRQYHDPWPLRIVSKELLIGFWTQILCHGQLRPISCIACSCCGRCPRRGTVALRICGILIAPAKGHGTEARG